MNVYVRDRRGVRENGRKRELREKERESEWERMGESKETSRERERVTLDRHTALTRGKVRHQ